MADMFFLYWSETCLPIASACYLFLLSDAVPNLNPILTLYYICESRDVF